MRKIGELKGKPIIEGNPNEIKKNWIHYKESDGGIILSERKEDNTLSSVTSSSGSGDNGGGTSEEEHWIGLQVGTEDMGINPFPMGIFNFSKLGRRLGNIYINKGIGVLTVPSSYGYGSIAHGGLLTYGDMMIPFKGASGVTYYTPICVNVKKGERLIYTNRSGAMQYDAPTAPDYNFGDESFTLEEIENKILESKLFINYPRNERIVAILLVIGTVVAFTGSDEWDCYMPIDEYLTNAGVDMFTTLEIVYPNKDEMLEFAKQQVIDFKG